VEQNNMNRFFNYCLIWVARMHPSNWDREGWEYPQLWSVTLRWWPRWNRKLKTIGVYRHATGLKVVQWLCGCLSGHHLSRTEWGYGGGFFVDRHCRWCDHVIRVPKVEEDPPDVLKDIVNELGWNK